MIWSRDAFAVDNDALEIVGQRKTCASVTFAGQMIGLGRGGCLPLVNGQRQIILLSAHILDALLSWCL